MSTLITGVPRAGKTTAAKAMDGPVRHTDDTKGMEWSEASSEVARWFDEENVIIEGVAIPRALRKWLKDNPTGKPADRVVWMDQELKPLDVGQRRMATGNRTVFAEIADELKRRGVQLDGWPPHGTRRVGETHTSGLESANAREPGCA